MVKGVEVQIFWFLSQDKEAIRIHPDSSSEDHAEQQQSHDVGFHNISTPCKETISKDNMLSQFRKQGNFIWLSLNLRSLLMCFFFFFLHIQPSAAAWLWNCLEDSNKNTSDPLVSEGVCLRI